MQRGSRKRLGSGAIVLLSLWSSTVLGQEQFPFAGLITQDDVPVHAGAGTSYYVVGKVPRGTVVKVDEQIVGWYKITPPPGVYSYISRGFVDARGDGAAGVVNKDRAAVFAANVKEGPGASYRRQLELFKGDRVEIADTEGGYYRITPPKGSYVYVLASAVEKTDFQPATPETPAPVVSEPPVEKPAPVVSVPPPVERPVPPVVVEPRTVDPAPTPRVTDTPPAAPQETLRPEPVVQPPVVVEPPIRAAEPSGELPPVSPPPSSSPSAPSPATSTFDPAPVIPATELPVIVSTPDRPREATLPSVVVRTPDGAGELPVSPPMVLSPSTTSAPPASTVPPTPSIAPAPPAPPASPASPAPPAVEVQAAPPVGPAPTVTVTYAPTSRMLKEVESRMLEAERLPLVQRPLDQMISAYEVLRQSNEIPLDDQRIVAARIVQLRRDKQIVQALKQIDQVQEQAQLEPPPPAPVPTRTNKGYDSIGQLQASAVYDGVSLPRLYRLVNPVDQRTMLYIKPSASLDPREHLGRVVGIVGPTQYDPGLRLKLLVPDRIDVVESAVPAQSP